MRFPGKEPHDFFVHADLETCIYLSKAIAETGQWEPFESLLVNRVLANLTNKKSNRQKSKLQILNIGANIGYYALLCTNYLETIYCDAFEPSAKNFAIFQANIELFGLEKRIRAMQKAVAAQSGRQKLYLSPENQGNHSLAYDATRSAGYEEVETTSLDDFYAKTALEDLADLAIFDTQGAEESIFRGATNLFKRGWQPLLFFEFYPSSMKCMGIEQLFSINYLHDLGYKFFLIEGAKAKLSHIEASSLNTFFEKTAKDDYNPFVDLIAVPKHLKIEELMQVAN